jgi:acyl carrier protein
MSDSLLNEVQEVFRHVFQQPSMVINRSSTADTISGWDSLTHMQLISAIESHFRISFTFNEVSSFNDVGDMINLIQKKTRQ